VFRIVLQQVGDRRGGFLVAADAQGAGSQSPDIGSLVVQRVSERLHVRVVDEFKFNRHALLPALFEILLGGREGQIAALLDRRRGLREESWSEREHAGKGERQQFGSAGGHDCVR
jgi:hypothetical protein